MDSILVKFLEGIYQGCTTYGKRWATKKSGTIEEGHNGSLGAVPPVGPGTMPLVRGYGRSPLKLTTFQ